MRLKLKLKRLCKNINGTKHACSQLSFCAAKCLLVCQSTQSSSQKVRFKHSIEEHQAKCIQNNSKGLAALHVSQVEPLR